MEFTIPPGKSSFVAYYGTSDDAVTTTLNPGTPYVANDVFGELEKYEEIVVNRSVPVGLGYTVNNPRDGINHLAYEPN